jgi:hypothetical protein
MPLFRSAHPVAWSARVSFLLLIACSCFVCSTQGGRKKPPEPTPNEEVGLKNIPLTIGHEAKGLVLPNYDLEGNLVGRFEAATAARIDEQHVRFTNLKMLTFDEHAKPNINIDMTEAVLNLDTRVINSNERATIKRTDFEIAGDKLEFNTRTHQGTLRGKVHMRIFNQKEIGGEKKR